MMVALPLVILNSFQNPAGLDALSREILKPVQDDDSISNYCVARDGI